MDLNEFWAQHPQGAAVAFSGGADSAYLLYSAARSSVPVRAYYVKTEFQPAFELADARRLAAELGVPLTVLDRSALADPAVAANPPDRCYHCKRRIFEAVAKQAAADGLSVILDGTNASDPEADRPGMRALRELQVLSPLRLCGLTKAEIRRRSREAGLFTWDKPAYACLATRFSTGTALTAEALASVEQAESVLAALGFRDFRVRKTPEGAKLQLTEAQLPLALARRQEIVAQLAPLVGPVTLDLSPRVEESLNAAPEFLHDEAVELRCNLDDMTGEEIAFAVEILLEQGALDVWTAPITMKKGRPAVLLTCLCRPEMEEVCTALLLRHTTTLGVRKTLCQRACLERTVRDGEIRTKEARGPGIRKQKPEFEDLAAAARREGLTLREIREKYGV